MRAQQHMLMYPAQRGGHDVERGCWVNEVVDDDSGLLKQPDAVNEPKARHAHLPIDEWMSVRRLHVRLTATLMAMGVQLSVNQCLCHH